MTLIVLPPGIRTRVAKLFFHTPAHTLVEGFAQADSVADIIREQGFTLVRESDLVELTKAAAQVMTPVPRTFADRQVLREYLERTGWTDS